METSSFEDSLSLIRQFTSRFQWHILLCLARIFHELLSRDHEDGRATGQPSRGTAGLVSVPERYVAG